MLPNIGDIVVIKSDPFIFAKVEKIDCHFHSYFIHLMNIAFDCKYWVNFGDIRPATPEELSNIVLKKLNNEA